MERGTGRCRRCRIVDLGGSPSRGGWAAGVIARSCEPRSRNRGVDYLENETTVQRSYSVGSGPVALRGQQLAQQPSILSVALGKMVEIYHALRKTDSTQARTRHRTT